MATPYATCRLIHGLTCERFGVHRMEMRCSCPGSTALDAQASALAAAMEMFPEEQPCDLAWWLEIRHVNWWRRKPGNRTRPQVAAAARELAAEARTIIDYIEGGSEGTPIN